MKFSSLILLLTFILLITALVFSNILLKKEYDKQDKTDIYWTYGKILEQPFKHLKIEGGNITNIVFQPGKNASVRVFKNWQGYYNNLVKASVDNDTLYLKFPIIEKDPYEKRYLALSTPVRIFSPELLSVTGFDTHLKLLKMQQKSISINLSGKSKFEVESFTTIFDSIHIQQSDSSEVIFEMSPDLKDDPNNLSQSKYLKDSASISAKANIANLQTEMNHKPLLPNSWETIYIKKVTANIQGTSLLNLGHAQIDSLKLKIADGSSILLSGGSLGRYKQ